MPTVHLGSAKPGTFVVPRFGKQCVCCNEWAMGRTQAYNPSTDDLAVSSIDVPVCFGCRKHAVTTPTTVIMLTCLVVVGGAASYLGWSKLAERPNDSFLLGMACVGGLALLTGVALVVRLVRREKRFRTSGHNAGFYLDLRTSSITSQNWQLCDELLELNPGSRLTLSKKEKRRVPEARARVSSSD